MLKLAVTALRPHFRSLNEPNDLADFHVPTPLPALPNDEVERRPVRVSSATRAQNSEAPSRRTGTSPSRPAPTDG